ncbi:hypothetical protein VNO78_02937 [Psophocarpus tetragonolobus]|uniref:Uncharacterized protein n=1 Tax=Psophocarpus tetragonolobus TaxID=3891 RepID=A0AAN9T0N6_PSOTE
MSVCEKSMQVVSNILTLSTLSFSHKTVRTSSTGKTMKNNLCEASEKGPLQLKGRRSQKPQMDTKSYLMPIESNDHESNVIRIERLEDDINKLAEVFIKKTRKKLLRDSGKPSLA